VFSFQYQYEYQLITLLLEIKWVSYHFHGTWATVETSWIKCKESIHLLLPDLLCQAFQHYWLISRHTLQDTTLQHEQKFPDGNIHQCYDINDSRRNQQYWYILLKSTSSVDVWNALYNALTVYPWRLEALLMTTIKACHTSSFRKFPAYYHSIEINTCT
jgi:hypothetical protein